MSKFKLSEKAAGYYKAHVEVFGKFPYGEPVREWTDRNGYTCIQYEKGNYFHYKQSGSSVVWW